MSEPHFEIPEADLILEDILKDCPGERVTADYIRDRIKSVSFTRIGTMTVCFIEVDNDYTVLGESACVDPENYRADLGEKIAYDKAFDKLWPLFGFLLAERRFTRTRP